MMKQIKKICPPPSISAEELDKAWKTAAEQLSEQKTGSIRFSKSVLSRICTGYRQISISRICSLSFCKTALQMENSREKQTQIITRTTMYSYHI